MFFLFFILLFSLFVCPFLLLLSSNPIIEKSAHLLFIFAVFDLFQQKKKGKFKFKVKRPVEAGFKTAEEGRAKII
jgi:hypothetical protein